MVSTRPGSVFSDDPMREYKSCICIRSAHLNCPLPLALESYWNCEADCFHCLGRWMNRTWGSEQRISNPEKVARRLQNALKAKDPTSPISRALKAKKTIWIGRKADPYQPIEERRHITRAHLKTLIQLKWSFVICSRYTQIARLDESLFRKAGKLCTFLIEITPGGESDWELFERKRTTPVKDRLETAQRWIRQGIHIGIRGEPFIPGYHTVQQFRDMLRRLRAYGIKSYNTYNLHLNEYTAKRLLDIGLDIEKVWEHNQDRLWKPIQQKLCQIADEEGVVLGCPDFVNVPYKWKSRTNTCCGVNVPNPFTFNTHFWRRLVQKKVDKQQVIEKTWEGIGKDEDRRKARTIMFGRSKHHYTMADAGL